MLFFFFNDTATTEIYTLSLHDALPISDPQSKFDQLASIIVNNLRSPDLIAGEEVQDNNGPADNGTRSEEHTSELQSPCNLVCRLLLEKKKYMYTTTII